MTKRGQNQAIDRYGKRPSVRVRAALADAIAEERPSKGGVLAALRRSPLVAAGIELKRRRVAGRKRDL